MMNNNIDEKGIEFLNRLYPKLHISNSVLSASRNDLSLKPNQKIEKYIDKLDITHTKYRDKERAVQRLKQLYYNSYIIKEENVPESYFDLQKKIALEQGHGYIEFDIDMRKEKIQTIINNQKASLDNWINYFINKDADVYHMWAKYWAFQGMITLGSFDKTKSKFNKRTDKTVNGFIDLNSEALAMSMDYVIKYNHGNSNIEDKTLEKLVENGSFSKIYCYLLIKLSNLEKIQSDTNLGEWIKYEQGTDHLPLVNSLVGHNTGWCTAGENTAKTQLSRGDFYVYYSYDENRKPTIPRIAIRMEENKIAEIRGVAKNQNIEPEMEEVVDQKLEEFPDKDKYKKKVSDMKKLTEIYNKHKLNQQLNIEELRFIYEIDSKIEGFGYQKDPRIKEIINSKDMRKDLSTIFECDMNKISFTPEEALRGNIVYHRGNLDLSKLENVKELTLPQIVGGFLDLSGLKKADGLILPQTVGSIYLLNISSGKGITFPKLVKGCLFLDGITNGEELNLSHTKILSLLNLNGITTGKDLNLPEKIVGSLSLNRITDAKNLTLPKIVGENLFLDGLTSGKGLILPETIGDSLGLNGLISGEGLIFPERVDGSLFLNSLTIGENLKLPQTIGGNLKLDGLIEPEGMIFPQKVGGTVNIRSLLNGQGLKLPQEVGGTLDLRSLTNGEGLILPQFVGGTLDLRRMISAKGLVLPQIIGGYLDLRYIANIGDLILPQGFHVSNKVFYDDKILTCSEFLKHLGLKTTYNNQENNSGKTI